MPDLGLPIPDTGSPPPADGTVRRARAPLRVTATNSAIRTMNRIALPLTVMDPVLSSGHHTVRSEAATAPIPAL